MESVGIVAEYNPFHRGHEYHLRQSRAQVGPDAILVCVMSGDYVQRGEVAIYSKFARAKAACACGADLVIELPLPWCLASAEGFARGAVSLIDSLGCRYLSFGSEAGKLDELSELAELLLSPSLNDEVAFHLSQHAAMSYASARQQVVAEHLGNRARLLETPNNILAVEYLKAITDLGSELHPITVQRIGSPHDGSGGEFQSASELRKLLRESADISGELPSNAAEVFAREESPDSVILETAILSRLRMLPEEEFLCLPDAADGLGQKLRKAAAEEPSLKSLMTAVKTKRYAMSRIRRLIFCAALGIHADQINRRPPYARLLAANDRGRTYLKTADLKLPLITKPACVRKLGGSALEIFELGARAHDLYVLGFPTELARRGGADWRTSPTIL